MKVMQKVSISGIKLSGKLVQLNSVDRNSFDPTVLSLLQILRENKINMPFVSTVVSGGNLLFTCCISFSDMHFVEERVASSDILARRISFVRDVGLVSIFPHRSSFKLLKIALDALNDAGIPLLGMASSVSSLTFVIKHGMFTKATTAMMTYLALPDGYTPMAPDTF